MTVRAIDGNATGGDGAVRPAGGAVTVLVGNPNVGKSLLFKNLTSKYVTVSNLPGTTVEIVKARANFDGRQREIIDTPGINDLSQRSDAAEVIRSVLAE